MTAQWGTWVGVTRVQNVRVRILSTSTAGLRCRFPDGHIERLHPDDVVLDQRRERAQSTGAR